VGAIQQQALREISEAPRHSCTGRVPRGASVAARALVRRVLFGAVTTADAVQRFTQRPAGAEGGGWFGAPPAAGVGTGTWGGWAPPSSPPLGSFGWGWFCAQGLAASGSGAWGG